MAPILRLLFHFCAPHSDVLVLTQLAAGQHNTLPTRVACATTLRGYGVAHCSSASIQKLQSSSFALISIFHIYIYGIIIYIYNYIYYIYTIFMNIHIYIYSHSIQTSHRRSSQSNDHREEKDKVRIPVQMLGYAEHGRKCERKGNQFGDCLQDK